MDMTKRPFITERQTHTHTHRLEAGKLICVLERCVLHMCYVCICAYVCVFEYVCNVWIGYQMLVLNCVLIIRLLHFILITLLAYAYNAYASLRIYLNTILATHFYHLANMLCPTAQAATNFNVKFIWFIVISFECSCIWFQRNQQKTFLNSCWCQIDSVELPVACSSYFAQVCRSERMLVSMCVYVCRCLSE